MLKAKSMNRHSTSAFTKLDMLVVIGALVMLALWVVFAQRSRHFAQPRAARINCVSNLKQVGLAFRMWANDHGDRFPWQVPVAQGGTKELSQLPYAVWHYVAVSNELHSPKILKCPNDTQRTRSTVWDDPARLGLSYFAGLSADEPHPIIILSGDRNISTNSSTLKGLLAVQDTTQLQWTKDLHQNHGNIGFADGSVAQLTSPNLRKSFDAALEALINQPVRLVIP
jgi:prepilin-type processing-associated H-X9-DG protein